MTDMIRSFLSPIKLLFQRNKCINSGKNVKIQYGAEILNTVFEKDAFVAHHASCRDSYIGHHTSIGRYSKIRFANIGKYCSISWDTTIGAVAHPLTYLSSCAITYRAQYGVIPKDIHYPQKEVVIGNDVWIGCNTTILSGVTIGDGAVIGAGAVVTNDIPPYAICVGVPARIVRYRIDKDLINRVIALRWWDWDSNKLKEVIHLFSQDVNESIVKRLEDYKKLNIRS